jgi:large subunit ribosomal protein L18
MAVKVLGKGKIQSRKRRHNRVRAKIVGTPERPRLMVIKSLRQTNAILVDDLAGNTLAFAGSKGEKSGDKTAKAAAVGKAIAAKASKLGVKSVVFDRGAALYHGRVKALADAARENGLEF